MGSFFVVFFKNIVLEFSTAISSVVGAVDLIPYLRHDFHVYMNLSTSIMVNKSLSSLY